MGEAKGGKKITIRHKEITRGMVVLINLTVVVVSLQYTNIKTQVFHFKCVQCTVCQLYLIKSVINVLNYERKE